MGYLYDHDSSRPLDPPPPRPSLAERQRWLEDHGATLCARPGTTLTELDIATAEWFMAWCKAPGRVPFPGCPQCERTTSLDLEPGQVASCGQHSYVRKGEPRQ